MFPLVCAQEAESRWWRPPYACKPISPCERLQSPRSALRRKPTVPARQRIASVRPWDGQQQAGCAVSAKGGSGGCEEFKLGDLLAPCLRAFVCITDSHRRCYVKRCNAWRGNVKLTDIAMSSVATLDVATSSSQMLLVGWTSWWHNCTERQLVGIQIST